MQHVYKVHAIFFFFYTTFIIKEHFQIFREMVKKKTLKMKKCLLFLVDYTMFAGKQKYNRIVVGTLVFVHICMEYVFYANLQFYVGSCHSSTRKSSRAEVTTSMVDQFTPTPEFI